MTLVLASNKLILSDISSTTISEEIEIQEFEDVYIVLIGSSTPNWNVKIRVGETTSTIILANAQSAINHWTYVHSKNTSSDASIDGATGITINSTTPVRLRINDFRVGKMAIEATRTAGNLTAYLEGYISRN